MSRKYSIAVLDEMGQVITVIDKLPSVTTVIHEVDASAGQALMGWAYNVGMDGVVELLRKGKIARGVDVDELKSKMRSHKLTPWHGRERAAERGTDVHKLAEQLTRGEIDEDDVMRLVKRSEQGYAKGLVRWHAQYEREPVELEAVLVSLTHGFAGRTDVIDKEPGGDGSEVEIVDFKTSKRIYDTHFFQGDAYGLAYEEMARRARQTVTVTGIKIVRFDKDGDFEEGVVEPCGGKVFLPMLSLYNALMDYRAEHDDKKKQKGGA